MVITGVAGMPAHAPQALSRSKKRSGRSLFMFLVSFLQFAILASSSDTGLRRRDKPTAY
jgi:hypothetical protein